VTIKQAIAELRQEARILNVYIGIDDDDLIIYALNHLMSDLELEFDEIEEEEDA
jgi:hypothetical protein